jgi:hypothetical protein
MPPTWLVALSWTSLAVVFACVVEVFIDIYGRGYRQKMRVMEAVWPVTALYFGPVASWAYRRFGRPNTPELTRLLVPHAGRHGDRFRDRLAYE